MLFGTYDRDIYYRSIIINNLIIHCTCCLSSRWLRAYGWFWKSADNWLIFRVCARNAWFPRTKERIESFYIASRTRQTSDSSWEFLKIEKWAYKNRSKQFLWIKRLCETTNLCVEVMKRKRQVKRKLGHVVQIRVCRLT